MAISTEEPAETAAAAAETDLGENAADSAPPESVAAHNGADVVAAATDGSALFFETVSQGNTPPPAQKDSGLPPAGDYGTGEALVAGDLPGHVESDRKEEVPALLGGEAAAEDDTPEIAPAGDAAGYAAPPEDAGKNDDPATVAVSAARGAEPGNNAEELNNIREILQDSLANTQYISAKIDAVSSDTEGLVKQVNGMSLNHELLAAELEALSSGAATKGTLSKSFLIIASTALAVLIVFQVYMFVSLVKIQQLQNAAGSSLLENINGLNKKMAEYNGNLSKALEKPAHQEHAQTNPAAATQTGHETAGNKESASAGVTPVLEKMNRLRNGLPERKLVRKETGDWFIVNKKNEECITDVEVVEVLNEAYKKIGRSLSPVVPMPSHKALCILKPDGKGGTEVVMTKEFPK